MLDQWRDAPHKDAPAMLQSDRALALRQHPGQALPRRVPHPGGLGRHARPLGDAGKLYEAAQQIDPNDREAAAGLRPDREAQEREGHPGGPRAEDRRQVGRPEGDRRRGRPRSDPERRGPATRRPAALGAADAAASTRRTLLREAAERRRIEEQRYRVLVDATIRRARQLLRTDPDSAYQDLKRQRDEIAGYDGIGDAARTQMVADLEAVMREIFLKGAEIKRQAEAERQADRPDPPAAQRVRPDGRGRGRGPRTASTSSAN